MTSGSVYHHGTPAPAPGSTVTLLLVSAVVGRSLIKSPSEFGSLNSTTLMPGYDSITAAIDADAPDAAASIAHYKLFDAKNLRVKYIIKCTLEMSHTAKDLAAAASAVDVYDRQDFFDLQAWQPVTLREKMATDEVKHLDGEGLVTVQEAYEHTLDVSKLEDIKVTTTKRAITNSLAALDDKVRLVNMAFASCEETIYQMAKDALKQLKNERERKVNVLRSTEHELRRKLAEVDFSEDHLVRQTDLATPVDFLRVWKSHTEKRKEFHGTVGDPANGLDAELKVRGAPHNMCEQRGGANKRANYVISAQPAFARSKRSDQTLRSKHAAKGGWLGGGRLSSHRLTCSGPSMCVCTPP